MLLLLIVHEVIVELQVDVRRQLLRERVVNGAREARLLQRVLAGAVLRRGGAAEGGCRGGGGQDKVQKRGCLWRSRSNGANK